MKNKIYFKIALLLLFCFCISCNRDKSRNLSQEETISFYSSPELYDLTKEWVDVYCKINPDVKIDVVKASESSIAENLDNNVNISFVSEDFDSVIFTKSLWKVVVGRDVIVLVINAANPFLDEIYRQGISPADLARIIEDPEKTNWGSILNTGNNEAIKLYVTEGAALHSGLADFLDTDQVSFNSTGIMDKKGLIANVMSDPYAIGICNITDVIDPGNNNILENIKILPIDKNGNGKIDYKENVYENLSAFSRGVWIGKYPRALSNNLYSVAAVQPDNNTELAFLKWVITSGQRLLDNHGLSVLEQNERIAQVKWINGFDSGRQGEAYYANTESSRFANAPLTGILVKLLGIFLAILLVLVLFLSVIHFLERRRGGLPVPKPIPNHVFNEDYVKIPRGLYYDKTHTWAFLDRDGLVKVGIDDFLQHITGPLTRVKMKSPGERIRKGKKAVSIIQDGKQLDIYAPVSGTIVEQNKLLSKNTSIMNSSPYTDGWVYKIEPSNWLKEVQFLLMRKSYKEWLKTEFLRLKEFLTDSIRPVTSKYSHVMQDGGELKDRILEDLGPEAWEDFQSNFIDISS